MKHRWLAIGIALVMLFSAQPAVLFCCAKADVLPSEAYFDREYTYSGVRDVPGKGEMVYYAQNDGLWAKLTYEARGSQKMRPFGDGGCAPAAVAMAIRRLVPDEQLAAILDVAKYPYAICSCSVNKYKCWCRMTRYEITSDRDLVRFLPLVIADFATGNNTCRVTSRSEDKGTTTSFIPYIARTYGLDFKITYDYQEALKALADGKAVVAHAGAGGAFTNTGHYVLLAHADEERVYVLDSLCRETYKTTGYKKLTIHEPGLVSLSQSEVRAANFGSYMIFSLPVEEEVIGTETAEDEAAEREAVETEITQTEAPEAPLDGEKE